MFHGRRINEKINHMKALRIVHNNIVTSFENLLIKDKSFTIHHQNIQSLANEIYKAIHNLPGRKLSEFFVRNNHISTIFVLNQNCYYQMSILPLKDKILSVISDQ